MRISRRLLLTIILPVCFAAALTPVTRTQNVNPYKLKRGITVVPDAPQGEDGRAPVVVAGTRGSLDDEYRDLAYVKEVVVLNRTDKVVRNLRLRWFATSVTDRVARKKIYQQGEMYLSPDLIIPPRASVQIQLPKPEFNLRDAVERWSDKSPEVTMFAITVGVSEVLFEDNSSWRAESVGGKTPAVPET